MTLYSPVGTISSGLSLKLLADAPAGATAGSHEFFVAPGNAASILNGTAPYNDALEFLYGQWVLAATSAYPPVGVQSALLMGTRFDSVTGLAVTWINNTTAGIQAVGGTSYIMQTTVEDLP